MAGLPEACRVPETYLSMPAPLDRTESRLLGRHYVRVVVLGPMFGRRTGRDPVLEQALERRLPGSNFEVEHAASQGLAEDDFSRLRALIGSTPADLVIWQVGVRDAMAASDINDFEKTLEEAQDWIEREGADLVLVDPPFVPGVRHERIYIPYIGGIGDVSRAEGVPLLRRYAAMQFLETEAGRRKISRPARPLCMPELIAEAIVRTIRK